MESILILIAVLLIFFLIYWSVNKNGKGIIKVKNRSDRPLDINIFRKYDTMSRYTREDLKDGEEDAMNNMLAGSYYSVIAIGHSYYERQTVFLPRNKIVNVEFDD